jgi:2',3'-cyclic-nucleotide 2'-phosphodiesterase (5'-nucleotidase family)
MHFARRLLPSILALGVAALPLGCGLNAPWQGALGRDGGYNIHGTGKDREIPLSPGVPNLGQQPVIPRDAAMDGKANCSIVYTNDIHSRVDPFPTDFYYKFYAGKGGFGRIATAIRDLKAQNPATIAVDSGDYLQGTPYFNFYKGEVEMKLMQAAGFDAITIGNHEFDNGVEDLRKVLPFYKGTLITTNMTFSPEVAHRYTVKKVGNVRVGMFALLTEVNGLVSAPNFKGAKYYDPIKVAQAAVAKLRKESDVVVLLSHMGTVPPYQEEGGDDHEVEDEQITDEILAERVPGIDVIVSGHTHVMIKNPKVIRNKRNGAKTFIVSSGMGGGYLGKADLNFDQGRLVGINNSMIPLTASVPNAADVESMVSPFRTNMDQTLKVNIGEAQGTFKRYGTKDTESTLNNLIADATLWAARTKNPKVDFAVMSSGTPRNHIMAGPISVEDVFYALPFDNKIDIVEVNGKQALEMLTVQRRPTDNKRHSISNVTYTLLKNFGPIKDVVIGGQPLDLNRKYVVAVNDYMAEGSSGFTMLPGNPRVQTGILQRDALINYIKAQKVLAPETGRIKLTVQ